MARHTRGRRTDYDWGAFGDTVADVDPGAAAAFATTATSVSQAATLMRIRGVIGATLNAGAVQEHMQILFGLVIVSSDAFAAGAAPEFTVDGSSAEEGHWIWTGSMYLSSGSEAAIVSDQLSQVLEVDSKAMRRMKANDVLALVHEIPAALAVDQAGDVDYVYRLRVLSGT